MDRQIIEISNNGFFLSLYRGFLVIENEKKQKQEIPLDNILSLILSADNTVISKNIVNAVIEQGGNIIFCDKKYLPSTILDKKVPKAQIARIMGVQKITLRRFIKRMGWSD